jgi:hypothetical protein
MNDRPTVTELLEAARHFLEIELIPTLGDARLRFQTLITANVLAIVERELLAEEEHLASEWQLLADLLQWQDAPPERLSVLRQAVRQGNVELCGRIRSGAFDQPARFREAAAALRQLVVRKLEVANPRYLAGFPK